MFDKIREGIFSCESEDEQWDLIKFVMWKSLTLGMWCGMLLSVFGALLVYLNYS